jgi:hypothetical protein
MNECDVAALDKLVVHSRCWEGVILCPNADGSGEYNLLSRKAVRFRKTMYEGKVGGLPVSSHSRQRTYGIPIPTLLDAIAGEWDNVKQQLASWAWKGGCIIVAKHHQKTGWNVLDKTMRCSRGEPYQPYRDRPIQFDATGVRPATLLKNIRQKHRGRTRISVRHPLVLEPNSRPFSTGLEPVVEKARRPTKSR